MFVTKKFLKKMGWLSGDVWSYWYSELPTREELKQVNAKLDLLAKGSGKYFEYPTSGIILTKKVVKK